MSALTLSGSDLTAAISKANVMATAAGGTVTHNAGWFILFATAALVVFVVRYIMKKSTRLGRS